MYDIILAGVVHDNTQLGIGLNGRLPWHCPEELALFKKKTEGSVLIFGRKTCQTLPRLDGIGKKSSDRIILCLSRNTKLVTKTYQNPVTLLPNLQEAISYAKKFYPEKNVFIAGGGDLYNEVFSLSQKSTSLRSYDHRSTLSDYGAKQSLANKTIHLSVMKKDHFCNKLINFNMKDYVIHEKEDYPEFTHYVLKNDRTFERDYLDLLESVLKHGHRRDTRNGETLSSFGKNLKFDLREGFPILTTRKLYWKGIVEELLFFIRGDTNSKLLEEKGVNIWKGNTDREFLDSLQMSTRKEGMMGPMYGFQWRHYNGSYNEETGRGCEQPPPFVKHESPGIDQLAELIELIKLDPHSRRLLLTTYNPEQSKDGVLYPCHSITLQFYVEGENIDVFCYNRSSDLFHGLPFNIASTSLLLTFIGLLTNYTPRFVYLSLGDCHIYSSHIQAVRELLERPCYTPPTLEVVFSSLEKTLQDVENLKFEDIILHDYNYGAPIKVDMVV